MQATLPEDARDALRGSGNAYLSHYSHIASTLQQGGETLTLEEFLSYFGILKGRAINTIENRIQTILETFGIAIIADVKYDQAIRNRIVESKPDEPRILIDHDAKVCTLLKQRSDKGFILATWDKVMIETVEDLARVYADTPARIIDFLSTAEAASFEAESNYEMLSILLHIDEKKSEHLAKTIERIKTVDQAYKLDAIVAKARAQKGSEWELKPSDVYPLLEDTSETGPKPKP